MPYKWGPHYIVPTEALKDYSGIVRLREQLDEDLLHKELDLLDIRGHVTRITNPWYYRKKGASTWIKIGESDDRSTDFAVNWNTRDLKNGQYQILGLMHVFVGEGAAETVIAGENVAEVTVKNRLA